jgi:hypothetical protein
LRESINYLSGNKTLFKILGYKEKETTELPGELNNMELCDL